MENEEKDAKGSKREEKGEGGIPSRGQSALEQRPNFHRPPLEYKVSGPRNQRKRKESERMRKRRGEIDGLDTVCNVISASANFA